MSKTLLAVVAIALCAAPAAAADAKYVKLVHADSGKVLAVADNSDEAGAKTVLAKDADSEAQQWKLEKDGDYYKIVNRKSGKVLDVEEASKDEGASIIQWDEKTDDIDNQRWSWQGDGKTRRLKSKSSELVLDVGDGGAIVQRKADDKAKGQLWQVVEAVADAKYVKLVHADTGKVLGVADDSEEAGAKTVLAKDDGSKARQWKLEKDGDHYKIVNRKTGKVLDVESASTDEGASIIQWDEKTDDIDNQRWSWQGDGKTRRLKSKSSELVLDVGDGDAIIQRKADDKAKGQLWQVVEIKD